MPAVGALVWCAISAHALFAASFEELVQQATAAREGDRVVEAIDLYRQALQFKSDWEEGWWYLGTLLYDTDRYAEGARAFSEFVKLTGKEPGLAFLGLCEFETGNYVDATEHLRRGLEGKLPPDIELPVRFHLGLLLNRSGFFELARAQFQTLVAGGVRNPVFMAALGLNALERSMLPGETPVDQREVALAAGNAQYLWLAGDIAGAGEAVRALVAKYPDAPGTHYFYARYLLAATPGDGITQELDRELRLNPQSAGARGMLALVLWQQKRVSEALPLARKVVDEHRPSPFAEYVYAMCLDDLSQASRHLEQALRLDPTGLEYHLALAHVYAKAGRYEDARRERLASIDLARQAAPRGSS
jgi:tetratricopeptide (TPR) repeat protein